MRLVDHSLDGRALGTQVGSISVVVEYGALCSSCYEPITKRESALFRWDRRRVMLRELGAIGVETTGVVEIVHVACVRRPL
jgi:hypothetical protein